MPLVQKLEEKFLGLYRTILDLKKRLESLQKSLNKAERDRDHYKELYKKEQEKCDELQQDSDDLHRVRRAFGSERIDVIIASERQQEAEIEAQRKAVEQQQKLARKRSDRDAR
jgi:multidrug resistance efflux pump